MGRPKKVKENTETEVEEKEKPNKPFELETFLIPLNELKETHGRIFQTTLPLDIALGGGIPEGTSVLLSGKPKLGKTSLAWHYIGQCHKVDPTKKVFYFDVEGRIRVELIKCFKHINWDNTFIVRSNDTKILCAEDYLNLILNTLKDNPGCICVLDSIAALCPDAELTSKIGDSLKMASTASLMYKMFRKISQILAVTKSTYIGITHMVANPNPGPGKKSMTVGGNANQYGASIWLEATYKENIALKQDEQPIGHTIYFDLIASPMSAPGKKVPVSLIYGKGICMEMDAVEICINSGIIKQAGAWFTFDDGRKFQGKMNIVKHFQDNPKEFEELEDRLRTMSFPNYESQINKKSE